MRLISLILLVAIVGAIVAFVMLNEQEVEVNLLNFYQLHTTMAKLVGAVYMLGMVSGWSVIGILRRSFERATDPGYRQSAQYR
jgi:hypothetical protein